MQERFTATVAIVIWITISGCGSPSSPERATEARVITTASWSGTFGDLGQRSGTGSSDVFNIGTGRQCATVTKHGSSNIANQSSMTVSVGDQSESTATSEFTVTRTVCGEGQLR